MVFDPSIGDRVAPFLSWGPYLCIDGLNPRSDGMVWTQSDLFRDCTHPSNAGEIKVANQLMAFFKSDTTTARWFLADGVPPPTDTPVPPTETPTPPTPSPTVTPRPDLPYDFYLPLEVLMSEIQPDELSLGSEGGCGKYYLKEAKP